MADDADYAADQQQRGDAYREAARAPNSSG